MIKVLIAPLDWGLGHATRCIPIIKGLQEMGVEVIIAGSGDSLNLLRQELPSLKSYELPGYNVTYSGSGLMVFKILLQLPRLVRVISGEHAMLSQIVTDEKINAVISDNRYGCWTNQVPSVFITHQVSIIVPGWLKIFQHAVRRYHIKMIRRFSACWIPDFPGTHSLAGKLVRFQDENMTNTKFIGNLSRFDGGAKDETKEYDYVAVLSGPEPQRTMIEKILLPQLKKSSKRYFVVRGLVKSTNSLSSDIPHADYMDTTQLQSLIKRARCIITRSGYSTIMDLAKLGSKAIFIPTPGQTEQIYLAKRLKKMRIAYYMKQDEFDLDIAHKSSQDFIGFHFTADRFMLLHEALSAMLATLQPHATVEKIDL